LDWSRDKNIAKVDNSFLTASQVFQQKIESSFPKGNYQAFGDAMLVWTGGVKFLNDFIFETINKKYTSLLKEGINVDQWFDTKFNLVGQLQKDESMQIKVGEISNDILSNSECNSMSLLLKYQEILEKKEVGFDTNSLEHTTLINMCLVILDKDNKLRILNKIYEKLLNQDWIKRVMAQLGPYAKAFWDWKSSAQSNSHLLHNNDLKLALEWLGKKPTPKLEVLEIEFVITSLVAEIWAIASPSVQSKATKLVIKFRRSLQGKNNYSDFLLQEILEWTKSQISALEKLLKLVNKTEIPAEKTLKWLESLVRSHIQNWSCQELFDFSLVPHGSQKEKDREIFVFFDEYLGMNTPQDVITEETRREYEKILDKYQELNENDFQNLVLTFLKRKFERICLMSQQKLEQKGLDVLLDGIVIGSRGHLKSILIFNLDDGLPLYHNKQLKSDDPALYQALFAEGGDAVGEAIEGFESLSKIQEALDSFGDVTKFGNLIYSIFRLEEGTMMVYFLKLTISLAICFIAPDGINLGLVVTRSQAKIKDIKNELEDLGF
jgi:hypothetical protein